MNKAPVEEL
jgi:hypothetical protein